MAKTDNFTKIVLGDKAFFHLEGLRKQNQLPVFLAAIGSTEVPPGAGVYGSLTID